MSTRSLTIGRLAASAGVNLETVRYYERIGLMPAPARTEGGHRSYEPEHAQRLRFIRRSRELGFGIDAIRRLIALSEPGVQACCQVRDMAQDHIAVNRRLKGTPYRRAIGTPSEVGHGRHERTACEGWGVGRA